MNRFEVSVPHGRLDLPLCVSSGQVFRWEALPDGRWLGVDGGHWYRVTLPKRSGVSDVFEIESNALRRDFESLFRLDWDASHVEEEITRRAPELTPYVASLQGLRLMRPSDPVEVFFCFLCTPNNNVKRITAMCRHLAAQGQVLAELDGSALHRFPDVESVAAMDEADLRAAGFGYRGKTIPSLARQLLERGGRSWLDSLKAGSYQEAHRELASMTGVGPKLADCIALFGLHHTCSVPVDTHLWQALTRLYRPEWAGKALTQQRYQAAARLLRDKLGDLAGWGHQYLFYENMMNWRARAKQRP